MGSQNFALTNKGIYKSLPTFSPDITGLVAIVTGANGISGFHTIRALLEQPKRWAKVYAVSRRPPPEEMLALIPAEHRQRLEHIAVDFLEDSATIADRLKEAHVNADYVFFYSYLQPAPQPGVETLSNYSDLDDVNKRLLDNFLGALPLANIKPRRFLLQTGAKNYGVHIGRWRTPAFESDPQPAHLAPNFYYSQEKSLFKYCEEHNVGWNIIRPGWIIGAVNNAQMNALYPFAVYAATQAFKGEKIAFPSTWDVWQFEPKYSTAMLTSYLSEWAVLEEKCENQAFNSADTSSLNWDRLYEELARWFGVSEGVEPPKDDDVAYTKVLGASGKGTPMGYGPPLESVKSFSLVDWAMDPKNRAAWKSLQKASNGTVTVDPFQDVQGVFFCGDASFNKHGTLCMNKARLLGWTGFVDTMESLFQTYKEMGVLGMLPEMKVKSARPQI